MTCEDFLQEILASPDDDTPRLIYADWLEERGDPRGEFIRLQCEAAALTKPAATWGMYPPLQPYYAPHAFVREPKMLPRYKQLLDRQLALMIAHCKDWAAPMGPDITGLIFERGFVEGGSTSAAAFVQHAPTWYRMTSLRQLQVKLEGNLASLLGCPLLLHVHALEIHDDSRPFGNHEALLLAACPHVVNLRHLRLQTESVKERGCQAILDSPYLQNLKSLKGLYLAGRQWGKLPAALEARFGQKSP